MKTANGHWLSKTYRYLYYLQRKPMVKQKPIYMYRSGSYHLCLARPIKGVVVSRLL